MNPCVDYCQLRYGQQYSPERCNTMCDYAKAVLENKELKCAISHGRWLRTHIGITTKLTCSQCSYEEVYGEPTNYCPNCGAKMDIKD